MATQRIITIFQLKRGDSQSWYTKNPVRALGEPGFEINTGLLKIGDGNTPWNELKYTNSKFDKMLPVQLDKIKPYLYEIYYDNIDYENAALYFQNQNSITPTGCTAVRKNNFYARNLDWVYNNDANFIVHLPRIGSRFASIAVTGSIDKLTEEFVSSGQIDDPMYKIVPFRIVDGINEHGVVINTNVVPTDKGYTNYTIPEVEERLKLNSMMIPRYVLDHFTTAAAAVNYLKDYVNVSVAKSMQEQGYEVHFMIADIYETYLVEFINNRTVVVNMTEESGTALSGKPYMTNFYLSDVELNNNGKVYTPYTQDEAHNAFDTNKITKKGAGLERYNYIVENYNNINTQNDMMNLMKNLYYTKAYQSSLYSEDQHWCTEFTGLNNPAAPEQILTVDTPYEDFIEVLAGAEYIYNNRSRDKDSRFYGTWQTVHTSVYDINTRKLYLISQEDDEELEFSLTGFDNLWEYGEGKYSIQSKGSGSQADADYSVADGAESIAVAGANYAHVGGFRTTAGGKASCTNGAYTVANNDCEAAFGRGNKSNINTSATGFGDAKNTLFSVGIGNPAAGQGKNAFEIMQNGDLYLIGTGRYDGTNIDDANTLQQLITIFKNEISILNSPENHRNIFRGKYLGSTVTQAQQTAIENGTFENLYIGDYWTINNIDWIIADMDYWYNTGDSPFTKHHLVIIPSAPLYNTTMNSTDTTSGGYAGSQMHAEGLEQAKTIFDQAFGTKLLRHREYLIDNVVNGKSSGASWYYSTVDLMSEIMVYGSSVRSIQTGLILTNSKQQLALFQLSPKAINTNPYWLRDVLSAASFAFVGIGGHTGGGGAVTSCGVRPVAAIG